MAQDFEQIFANEAFDHIDPAQKEAFKNLAKQLDGKNMAQSIGIITEFMKQMPKGKSLEKEQQEAMITAVLSGMPEEQRNKFQNMLKLYTQMSKK